MSLRPRPFSLFEVLLEFVVRAPALAAEAVLPAARRLWWLPFAAALYVYFFFVYAVGAEAGILEGWFGLSLGQATVLAAAMAVLGQLMLVVVAANMFTGSYSRVRPSMRLLSIGGIPVIVTQCCVLDAHAGFPFAVALAISVAVTGASLMRIRAIVAKMPTPGRLQVLWLDDPSRAGDLVRECERDLTEGSMDPDERAAVEANLATGLAAVALLSEGEDGLPRAYALLAEGLHDRQPMDTYIGAARLVEAMRAKAGRTGDIEGYEEALRLMLDAASMFGALSRCVMARARLIHATHLAELAGFARAYGEPGRAARLHQEAVDDLLVVFERSLPLGVVRPSAQIMFASLVDRTDSEFDAAIALCRVALRRLRGPARLERNFGRLVLCDLLVARAQLDRSHARRDVAEALRLCRRLERRATSRADAVRRLPRLLRLDGREVADVDRAYRAAFGELSQLSGGAAGDLAADWAGWAAASASPEAAGEAHWQWIRAVADDARRRPLRAEKERRLAQSLGMAAKAGASLVAAGRPRDAAVALDLGRAMLLTERMRREPEGIDERLVAAGRADLVDRLRATRERIAEADRATFSARRIPANTMLIGGRRFQQRFTSIEHVALAEHEQLLREIAGVPGCEDVDAPPAYDDLQAAAEEGPIVYLSATALGTDAVIVTADGEPQVVSLAPTAGDLDARARRLIAGADADADALASLVPWLWGSVMRPVAACLPARSLVTLIPLGALSLLPLHVASTVPDDDGIWHDRSDGLVFRYAPNARVLRRAQSRAGRLAGKPLRVLTVGVATAPGELPLACADDESAGVFERFREQGAERPTPASRDMVLAAMDRCEIWHFACHGVHHPTNPLDSALVLGDERLTLRSIFARPEASSRLAVLAACRTATPDARLLDELVSFPSALLQAGVAGVVCAQSDIPDRAAMLLVLRFFDELEHATPPRALARAQAWLRAATNARLHDALGDAHPLPTGLPPAQFALWMRQREFVDPVYWAPLSYCGA
jgi:hypothetical protein